MCRFMMDWLVFVVSLYLLWGFLLWFICHDPEGLIKPPIYFIVIWPYYVFDAILYSIRKR